MDTPKPCTRRPGSLLEHHRDRVDDGCGGVKASPAAVRSSPPPRRSGDTDTTRGVAVRNCAPQGLRHRRQGRGVHRVRAAARDRNQGRGLQRVQVNQVLPSSAATATPRAATATAATAASAACAAAGQASWPGVGCRTTAANGSTAGKVRGDRNQEHRRRPDVERACGDGHQRASLSDNSV